MWSICRYNVINVTKILLLDFMYTIGFDVWWSKDGHYDRLLTKKISLAFR